MASIIVTSFFSKNFNKNGVNDQKFCAVPEIFLWYIFKVSGHTSRKKTDKNKRLTGLTEFEWFLPKFWYFFNAAGTNNIVVRRAHEFL